MHYIWTLCHVSDTTTTKKQFSLLVWRNLLLHRCHQEWQKYQPKNPSPTMSRESLRISKYPGVIKVLHIIVSDTLLNCMLSHLNLVLEYIVLHHYSDSLNIYLCLFKVKSLLFNTLCCNFIHLGPCLYMIMCLLFSFQCW